MDFMALLEQFPFLIPIVVIIVILVALALWKIVKEFFPWQFVGDFMGSVIVWLVQVFGRIASLEIIPGVSFSTFFYVMMVLLGIRFIIRKFIGDDVG